MLRTAAPLALLLTFLLLPGAAAQMQGPAFQLGVEGMPSALAPGTTGTFNLTIERVCPNAATVMPEQTAHLSFKAAGEIQVGGPLTAYFPQTACAAPEGQELRAEYQVAVDRFAEHGRAFKVQAQLEPGYTGVPLGYSEPAQYDFIVQVASAPPPENGSMEVSVDGEENIPSPAFTLLALGLVGAVAAIRRRGA